MVNSEEFDVALVWFDRVWRQEDSKAIDDLFPGGEIRGLGKQTTMTPATFKVFHSALCSLITDINVTIDKHVQDGQWLSALCTLSANKRDTGQPVTMTGNVWVRIENGQIQEAYNHFDFLGLWEQLGLLPPDCFEKGLSGIKIA